MDNKKILLADASEPVQKVIYKAFEEEDYDLTVAIDYGSAIKIIAAEAPALILAGASLPGKDGYSLCEFVKNNAPSIPVVILVGTDETLNSGEADRVGVDDYFIRPFKSKDLIERIGKLLAASPKVGTASVTPATEPESGEEGSAEDLLSEMGLPDIGLEELDIVYTNEKKIKPAVAVTEGEDVKENESIEDFLSDLDSDTDSDSDSDSDSDTDSDSGEVLKIVPEKAPVDRVEGAKENTGTATISFNEDAIIEEPELAEPEFVEPEEIDPLGALSELAEPLKVVETPAVEGSVEEKGAVVEGIVEISKSKIEKLILESTREDVKKIAYELVPGLVEEPIKVVVPDAVQRVAEKIVGEIATETTGKVAEGIIQEVVAEIVSRQAAEHIARIAGEAVMKAAEERMKEIATEAAEKMAKELISNIVTDTTVKAAENLITEEIKKFKSTLSKEG